MLPYKEFRAEEIKPPEYHPQVKVGLLMVVTVVKNLPANAGDRKKLMLPSLGQKDPLEKGMASHSSIPAWRIPWTENPSGLQGTGWQRVWHNWATNTHTDTPAPTPLTGKWAWIFSLFQYAYLPLCSGKESDTTERPIHTHTHTHTNTQIHSLTSGVYLDFSPPNMPMLPLSL